MKKISIVIINYNGQKDTIECLDSLMEIEREGFDLETIVVDNASKEPFKVKEGDYKNIGLKIIYNPFNSGFSGGNNVGLEKALNNDSSYILLLNNDTIVKKDFLRNLFNYAKAHEEAGIIVPKIYFAKGHEFHGDRYKPSELGKVFWYAGGVMDWRNVLGAHRGVDEVDRGQYDKTEDTDFATGCCMLIGKEVFDKIGLLDEKYFLYYEDSDFSEKAKRAGYKVIYFPDSVIWHKNAGSTGGSGSRLQDYYIARNRLYFGMKFAPLRSKIALARESLKLLAQGREMQKKGIVDYYSGKMGKSRYF